MTPMKALSIAMPFALLFLGGLGGYSLRDHQALREAAKAELSRKAAAEETRATELFRLGEMGDLALSVKVIEDEIRSDPAGGDRCLRVFDTEQLNRVR